MIALAVVGGIIAMVIAVCVTSYISNYNYGNRAEKEILAAWENNENILAQYSLKVGEIAQVPTMYKDDLKEVYTGIMAGRYGNDGSQAMFQWFQEQDIQFDSTLYTQIQQVMEAGRTKFENSQTVFVDKKRAYETNLGYLWKGTWLRIAGYPKINLDDYKIITSGHAQQAFETGVDEGVKIR
jgi:hypothetical protein